MDTPRFVPARVMAWLRALPLEATRISVQAELQVGDPDKPEGGWLTCGSVDCKPPTVERDGIVEPVLDQRAEDEAQGTALGDPPHVPGEAAEWLEVNARDWTAIGRRIMQVFHNGAGERSSKLRLRAFKGRAQVDMMTAALVDEDGAEPGAGVVPFGGQVAIPRSVLEFMAVQNEAIAGREEMSIEAMRAVISGANELVGAVKGLAESQAETIRLAASMDEKSWEDRAFDLFEAWLQAKTSAGVMPPQLQTPAPAPAALEDKRAALISVLQGLSPEEGAALMRDPAVAPQLAAIAAAARGSS